MSFGKLKKKSYLIKSYLIKSKKDIKSSPKGKYTLKSNRKSNNYKRLLKKRKSSNKKSNTKILTGGIPNKISPHISNKLTNWSNRAKTSYNKSYTRNINNVVDLLQITFPKLKYKRREELMSKLYTRCYNIRRL